MVQPGEVGYGLSGNNLVNWVISQKFKQSATCGADIAAIDTTYKTGNAPTGVSWKPYFRFGALQSGDSYACNGDKGVNLAKHFGNKIDIANSFAFAKTRIYNAGNAKDITFR